MPSFAEPRLGIATVKFRQGRPDEAIAELRAILDIDPGNESATRQLANTLGHLARYDEALAVYESFLAGAGESDAVRVGYSHMLKTVGRTDDAIAAYRSVLGRHPAHGEAWWSLANLKTSVFGAEDIRRMETTLGSDADEVMKLLAKQGMVVAPDDVLAKSSKAASEFTLLDPASLK